LRKVSVAERVKRGGVMAGTDRAKIRQKKPGQLCVPLVSHFCYTLALPLSQYDVVLAQVVEPNYNGRVKLGTIPARVWFPLGEHDMT
jgi:hypothetical protein